MRRHAIGCAALVLAAIAVGWITGCASKPPRESEEPSSTAPAATGRNWIVVLRARESRTNFFALFDLERDGTLTYTAGVDTNVVWRGRITAEEEDAIVALVSANPDPTRAPVPGEESPAREYRLSTCPPGAFVSTTFESGPTEYLDRLYALFQRIQQAHRKGLVDPAIGTKPP